MMRYLTTLFQPFISESCLTVASETSQIKFQTDTKNKATGTQLRESDFAERNGCRQLQLGTWL